MACGNERYLDEWFAELDEDGQAELIAKVELLKLLGPKLGRPHADSSTARNMPT